MKARNNDEENNITQMIIEDAAHAWEHRTRNQARFVRKRRVGIAYERYYNNIYFGCGVISINNNRKPAILIICPLSFFLKISEFLYSLLRKLEVLGN